MGIEQRRIRCGRRGQGRRTDLAGGHHRRHELILDLGVADDPLPICALSTDPLRSPPTLRPDSATCALESGPERLPPVERPDSVTCAFESGPERSPPVERPDSSTSAPVRESSAMSAPVSDPSATFEELTAPEPRSDLRTLPFLMSKESTLFFPGSAVAVPAIAKQNSAM